MQNVYQKSQYLECKSHPVVVDRDNFAPMFCFILFTLTMGEPLLPTSYLFGSYAKHSEGQGSLEAAVHEVAKSWTQLSN